MVAFENPALRAFVGHISDELLLAQAFIRRVGTGWELRHIDDRERAETELRALTLDELRQHAQFTADGKFRPLKSAPTLAVGWRFVCASDDELYDALNRLYPGAVADWFAAQQSNPPVTHYREFTARQSGMYRITAMLDDALAADVTRASCHPRSCLKRRLWTVPGLAPDTPENKSLIPCLEPCAVLLESARKAARAKLDREAGVGSADDEP
jgi:hypothetical protein